MTLSKISMLAVASTMLLALPAAAQTTNQNSGVTPATAGGAEHSGAKHRA